VPNAPKPKDSRSRGHTLQLNPGQNPAQVPAGAAAASYFLISKSVAACVPRSSAPLLITTASVRIRAHGPVPRISFLCAAPSGDTEVRYHIAHATRDARGRGCTRPLVVDICLRRDFNEGAALSSHPGTTFAALGRDSRASALAGRSSVDRLVFVAA
jgi:hypothetical protein